MENMALIVMTDGMPRRIEMTVGGTASKAEMKRLVSPAKVIGFKSIIHALTKKAKSLNRRMMAGLLRPSRWAAAMS